MLILRGRPPGRAAGRVICPTPVCTGNLSSIMSSATSATSCDCAPISALKPQDTDAVKQMVSEGEVVGLRKRSISGAHRHDVRQLRRVSAVLIRYGISWICSARPPVRKNDRQRMASILPSASRPAKKRLSQEDRQLL